MGNQKSISCSFVMIVLFISIFLSGNSSADTQYSANENCAAILSSDVQLHVPIATFNGQAYWADFQAMPNNGEIQLTSNGLIIDVGPFASCRPALLSPDLILHIPTILFDGVSYLADFQHGHDLFFTLIGAGPTGNTTLYQLSSASSYQEGCVSPCSCPVTIGRTLSGTFSVIRIKSSPLFDSFSLDEVSWTVTNPDGTVAHAITGFGIYHKGGELANMHQLILELSIDNSDLMHFDSGLVPNSSQSPATSISVDRGTACFDISMSIIASPSE